MASTRIVAVRHGETEWNISGKQQGHLDSPLTETGRMQASALGFGLTRFSFDAFYSSDLGRAVQTAEIISGEIGLGYEYDRNFREINLGIMQGFSRDEFKNQFPDKYEKIAENNPKYIIPDGESLVQFFDRATAGAEAIAETHKGGTVLIVTHGGTLMRFFQKALNLPLNAPRAFSLNNGAINIFSIDDNKRWSLEVWGEITHLDRFNLPSLDDTTFKK